MSERGNIRSAQRLRGYIGFLMGGEGYGMGMEGGGRVAGIFKGKNKVNKIGVICIHYTLLLM